MARKKRYHNAAPKRGSMKSLGSEFYAGMDSRRREEFMDSEMIHEDRNAIANLPQEVIMKQYPRAHYEENYDLDDTMRGVDVQMRDDSKRKKKGPYPEKY